ncbi:hypothetical protein ES703_77105 [subsurface metagenome]
MGPVFGAVMLAAILIDMIVYGRGWDLVLFVFVLYCLSLLIHTSLRTFCDSVWSAVRAGSQIFLQFQWYGGIMGLMVWSGLALVIARGFADVSTTYTWPFWNFIQASIVNVFIPSGGGQFTATSAYIVESSKLIGVPMAPMTMTSFAMGDQLTNMIQPFWALPVIAIAALALRKVMGYCVIVLITAGVASVLWLFIAPLFLGG